MRGKATLRKGIAAGVFAAVVAALVIPLITHRRVANQAAACIETLEQINGAKLQWALENHADTNATPTWEALKPYGGRASTHNYFNDHFPPQCPSGGTYTIERAGVLPTCSYPGHALSADYLSEWATVAEINSRHRSEH